MSQLHETEEDLRMEQVLSNEISVKWNLKLVKLPICYNLDYAAYNTTTGLLEYWIEIRHRMIPVTKYPTVLLSALKVINAKLIAKTCRVQSIFVVRWIDGVTKWIRIDDLHVSIYEGDHIVRRDNRDIEPVAHIPIENMNTF